MLPSKDGEIRSCILRFPLKQTQVSNKRIHFNAILKFVTRGIERLCLLEADLEQRESSSPIKPKGTTSLDYISISTEEDLQHLEEHDDMKNPSTHSEPRNNE